MDTTRVGTVCLVEELASHGRYLYGVFTDEATARADYGVPDPKTPVTFTIVSLFGPVKATDSATPGREGE